MKRSELEHIIRASGSISNDLEIIIIGSQAILGQYPDAPQEFLMSMEADVIPRNYPDKADLIDGTIGELSPFHHSFGYYAHGVGMETAILPRHWQNRLVPIKNENTMGVKGLCLEVHDLAISKLIAGRDKDLEYYDHLVRRQMIQSSIMLERLEMTELEPEKRKLIELRIKCAP